MVTSVQYWNGAMTVLVSRVAVSPGMSLCVVPLWEWACDVCLPAGGCIYLPTWVNSPLGFPPDSIGIPPWLRA